MTDEEMQSACRDMVGYVDAQIACQGRQGNVIPKESNKNYYTRACWVLMILQKASKAKQVWDEEKRQHISHEEVERDIKALQMFLPLFRAAVKPIN